MKTTTRQAIWWSGLIVLLTFQLGCGKPQESSADGATETPGAPSGAAESAAGAGSSAGPGVVETAQKVADEAAARAQALIDQTRGYLSEQNYAKASEGLEKLAGMSLTPEQQKLVGELKTEVGKVSDQAGAQLAELKALVDAKKYQEASGKLGELANVSLTPEQQELLDRLKAEIQKGLSGDSLESGKKAVGGLLQGN
jgi:hypothetical protein